MKRKKCDWRSENGKEREEMDDLCLLSILANSEYRRGGQPGGGKRSERKSRGNEHTGADA